METLGIFTLHNSNKKKYMLKKYMLLCTIIEEEWSKPRWTSLQVCFW